MNMPMHIMAKPIQTVAVTASAGLFSVAEIIAGPEDSCCRPLDTSPSSRAQTDRGGHADQDGSIALSHFGSKRQRPGGDSMKFSRFDRNVGGSRRWQNPLCLIFVTLKRNYDRPLRGRAPWNCWAKIFSSAYWS